MMPSIKNTPRLRDASRWTSADSRAVKPEAQNYFFTRGTGPGTGIATAVIVSGRSELSSKCKTAGTLALESHYETFTHRLLDLCSYRRGRGSVLHPAQWP